MIHLAKVQQGGDGFRCLTPREYVLKRADEVGLPLDVVEDLMRVLQFDNLTQEESERFLKDNVTICRIEEWIAR